MRSEQNRVQRIQSQSDSLQRESEEVQTNIMEESKGTQEHIKTVADREQKATLSFSENKFRADLAEVQMELDNSKMREYVLGA